SQTSRGAAARRHTAMAATTAPTATTPGAGEPAASISTTAAATAAPLSTAHGPTAPPAAPLAAPPTSGPTGTALGLWEVGSGPAAAVLEARPRSSDRKATATKAAVTTTEAAHAGSIRAANWVPWACSLASTRRFVRVEPGRRSDAELDMTRAP